MLLVECPARGTPTFHPLLVVCLAAEASKLKVRKEERGKTPRTSKVQTFYSFYRLPRSIAAIKIPLPIISATAGSKNPLVLGAPVAGNCVSSPPAPAPAAAMAP